MPAQARSMLGWPAMQLRAALSLAMLTTSTALAQPAPPPAPREVPQPNVLGVSLGLLQTADEADAHVDASSTVAVFGRLGLTRRLSAQLDLGRLKRDDNWQVLSGTASLRYAFGSSWLVPAIRLGAGYDRASLSGVDHSAVHAELGFSLEAHLDGGLVLGADLATGARARRDDVMIYCALDYDDYLLPGDECGQPLPDDTYRTAKVTLGIAF